MSYKYTLQELADKLDYEGGLGEGFMYFGRNVNTVNNEFNEQWARAYDAYMILRDMIPEPEPEWED
jgi:hypothetical protein